MRRTASLCCLLVGTALACRPVSDLDATRRGAGGAVASSDAPSSELPPNVPLPPPPSPTSGQTTASTDVHPSPASNPAPSTERAPMTSDGATTNEQDNSSDTAIDDLSTTPDVTTPLSSTELSTIVDTSTDSEETSSAPKAECTRSCGVGAPCSELTDCLSLRCDDVCQPMEMVVHSDGLDAISTSIKVHVELYGDPAVAVAWRDLAVLYFVTVEKRNDFKLNFAQGGGTTMPMQVTLKDWIMVWTTDAAGNIPATVTPFDVQIHSYPWLDDEPASNDNSNDHSYRKGLGQNDNIVLCRRVDGEWRHAQGNPPPNIKDPCRYVGNCDAVLSCDPLEPSPPT